MVRENPETMKRKDRDTYVLSTGRQIRANHGLIGIARAYGDASEETFESFEISEGYNSHLDEVGVDGRGSDGRVRNSFTPAERVELAEFMIAQWSDLKRHAAAAIGPARKVTSVALELDRGIVRLSLDCGHEAEVHLADPVLAVTETYALPRVGDERPCAYCKREAPGTTNEQSDSVGL
jgi:hypothetical protein